jgi:hypothetical protein
MNRRLILLAISFLFVVQANALAQSQDLPKFEFGGEFTTLEREGFGERRTEAGAGARFTFNFNRSLAFETAGYFFPRHCDICRNAGNMSEVVAGVKVGKRFENWGIFAKARPGVVSFSRGEFNPVAIEPHHQFRHGSWRRSRVLPFTKNRHALRPRRYDHSFQTSIGEWSFFQSVYGRVYVVPVYQARENFTQFSIHRGRGFQVLTTDYTDLTADYWSVRFGGFAGF